MLNEKLLEVISSPPDAALTIATQGADGPHLVNSWNSYVQITDDDKLLIPAGGMNQTEKNLAVNSAVKLTICNRDVQGPSHKGAGFVISGTGAFLSAGKEFDLVKAKFSWARAAFVITVDSAKQTF